ncbi:helix-turn-helix domain-containing protein [Planctomycetales bacterium ZRK34]|nr:helix-turn-helix domain-containing protein [Planctomycetales bacterium ZRK34]
MNPSAVQFGRIPYALGDTDIISRMKPSDAKVYLAMALHSDDQWQVTAGQRRLAKIAGVKLGTVSEAARRLESLGAILIDWPGNGHSATYTLTVQHIQNGLPFSTHRTDKCMDRSARIGGTVRQAPIKPFSARRTKQIEQNKKQSAQAAPASAAGAARKRDPIWDAVVEAFKLNPITKAERSRVGKIVRDLRAKGATPDDIRRRLERYRATWPDMTATPEALVKHWDMFAAPAGALDADPVEPPDEVFTP